jgi:hypothetical protein
VLGPGPGHPPPHASAAHHGATWPLCRRYPPPSGLRHPWRRHKSPLLTLAQPSNAVATASVRLSLRRDRLWRAMPWHETGLPLGRLTATASPTLQRSAFRYTHNRCCCDNREKRCLNPWPETMTDQWSVFLAEHDLPCAEFNDISPRTRWKPL